MYRLAVLAAAILITSPVLAEGVTLTIRNASSHAVTRLNTFAVDADVQPVEDNLGAILEDIPAGSTGHLQLDLLSCQQVYVAASLAGSSSEMTTTVDTCKSRTLVVRD